MKDEILPPAFILHPSSLIPYPSMSEQLAGFSQWTLDLLPRLFLYPGGLWALFALVGLRLASGGVQAVHPRSLSTDLLHAPLLPTATAWVALALLALPGTAPLTFPADRLVLVGLLVTSLVLDRLHEPGTVARQSTHSYVEVALALAALAPLAGGRALLAPGSNWGAPGWLAMLAVAAGLCALSNSTARDLAGALRWLGWIGVAAYPVWALGQPLHPGAVWASLLYMGGIGAIAGIGRLTRLRKNQAAVICWGLSLLALVWALAT